MIRYFSEKSKSIKKIEANDPFEACPIWIDLLAPTPRETQRIEKELNINIPCAEERHEIETSSRLFSENGILYMTFSALVSTETDRSICTPVTFIFTPKCLLTLRLSDTSSFQAFAKALQRSEEAITPAFILIGLLEAIADRMADLAEVIAAEIDTISREIFQMKSAVTTKQREMRDILLHLGKKGDLCTTIRESLGSIHRLILFYSESASHLFEDLELKSRTAILTEDVISVTDYVSFHFNKIHFLLEATLGLVNIEQNAIIKIFSVAAVIFLPPTLIASIYGMNFKVMPELSWWIGYPLALVLMIVSAFLPFLYFKRKGWL